MFALTSPRGTVGAGSSGRRDGTYPLPVPAAETQTIGEIVGIAIEPARCFCVQKALALDEIDEHQAVEHDRGIPLAISLRVNPTDEFQERSMFAFEAVIELLRDTLDIESFCHAPGHLGHLQALFLFQSDGQSLQFLRQ